MLKIKGYVTFTYDAHMLTTNEIQQLVKQSQAQLIADETLTISEIKQYADKVELIIKIDGFTDAQRMEAICVDLNIGDDYDDDTDNYMCESYGMIFPSKQITALRALAWVKHYTASFTQDEFQKFAITKQMVTDEALIIEFVVELPSYVINMDLYYLSDQERYQYFRIDDQATCDDIKEVPIEEYSGTHRLELSTHEITLVFKQAVAQDVLPTLLTNFEKQKLMANEVIAYTLPHEELITELPVIVKALGINHQVIQCMFKELPEVLTVEVN